MTPYGSIYGNRVIFAKLRRHKNKQQLTVLCMNHTSFLPHTHGLLNTVSLVWHGSSSTSWWVLIAAESRVWFSKSGVAVWIKAAAGHSGATLTPRGAGTQPLTSWLSQLQSSSACLEHHITLCTHPRLVSVCVCVCVCGCLFWNFQMFSLAWQHLIQTASWSELTRTNWRQWFNVATLSRHHKIMHEKLIK